MHSTVKMSKNYKNCPCSVFMYDEISVKVLKFRLLVIFLAFLLGITDIQRNYLISFSSYSQGSVSAFFSFLPLSTYQQNYRNFSENKEFFILMKFSLPWSQNKGYLVSFFLSFFCVSSTFHYLYFYLFDTIGTF